MDALIILKLLTSKLSSSPLPVGTIPLPFFQVLAPNKELPSIANLDVPQPLS